MTKEREREREIQEVRYRNEYERLFTICYDLVSNVTDITNYLCLRFEKVANKRDFEVRADYIDYELANDYLY